MKVNLTLEFASPAEASTFLAGLNGGTVKATVAAQTGGLDATATAQKAAEELRAKADIKKKADAAKVIPPVIVDTAKTTLEFTELANRLLNKDAPLGNAGENKTYILGLITKYGGAAKFGSIEPAKQPAYLADLRGYVANLESQAVTEVAEESLV